MMILTKRFCDPPNLSPIGFWRARSGFLRCESMVFVVQKVGICGAKVWFFVVQKVVFCSAKVWFFVVQKYGFSWVYVYILQCVRALLAGCQQL